MSKEARMTYTMWIAVSQAMAFMFCLKEMWLEPVHHNSTCQQWSSAKPYLLLVVSVVSKMRRLFKWKKQALISSGSFIPALKPSFKVCKRQKRAQGRVAPPFALFKCSESFWNWQKLVKNIKNFHSISTRETLVTDTLGSSHFYQQNLDRSLQIPWSSKRWMREKTLLVLASFIHAFADLVSRSRLVAVGRI
jgi:hypothetical protein